MPRRSLLSSAERDSLFVLPDTQDDLIRYYTLTESDRAITNQQQRWRQPLGLCRPALLHALSRPDAERR